MNLICLQNTISHTENTDEGLDKQYYIYLHEWMDEKSHAHANALLGEMRYHSLVANSTLVSISIFVT